MKTIQQFAFDGNLTEYFSLNLEFKNTERKRLVFPLQNQLIFLKKLVIHVPGF